MDRHCDCAEQLQVLHGAEFDAALLILRVLLLGGAVHLVDHRQHEVKVGDIAGVDLRGAVGCEQNRQTYQKVHDCVAGIGHRPLVLTQGELESGETTWARCPIIKAVKAARLWTAERS